jgi:hypothetical protein
VDNFFGQIAGTAGVVQNTAELNPLRPGNFCQHVKFYGRFATMG